MEVINLVKTTLSTNRLPFSTLSKARHIYGRRVKSTGKIFLYSVLGVYISLVCLLWPTIVIPLLACGLAFITAKSLRVKGKLLEAIGLVFSLANSAIEKIRSLSTQTFRSIRAVGVGMILGAAIVWGLDRAPLLVEVNWGASDSRVILDSRNDSQDIIYTHDYLRFLYISGLIRGATLRSNYEGSSVSGKVARIDPNVNPDPHLENISDFRFDQDTEIKAYIEWEDGHTSLINFYGDNSFTVHTDNGKSDGRWSLSDDELSAETNNGKKFILTSNNGSQ